jgi:hypothetical protein
MNTENDRLESLIDRALSSYTAQEACPGLEERILSAITVNNSPRSRVWGLRMAWPVAAGVLLLVVAPIPMWIGSGRPRVTLVRRSPVSQPGHPAQTGPALASSAPMAFTLRPLRTHAALRVPAQPQFGLPCATKQELLLVRFAAKEPELLSASSKEEPNLDAPISIPALPDDPVVTEPVEIKPIALAPIQISSLKSPD